MPTTRRQAALQEEGKAPKAEIERKPVKKKASGKQVAQKVTSESSETKQEEPPTKKAKTEVDEHAEVPAKGQKYTYQPGTIERGHIYFFYRPKIMLQEVSSVDEVRNFHMLLVPRPPAFITESKKRGKTEEDEAAGMKVLEPGADAVPAPEPVDQPKRHYRLVTVGKKQLPDPEPGGVGRGRKQTFWATVTAVGDDLHSLEQGLGEKTYETKTRGTRHQDPARLAARGAYAIVNNDPPVPSRRTTHFGYYISHPSEVGEVQDELGIGKALSFVMQVKNPLAPATTARMAHAKGADYPDEILPDIFGTGGAKGREEYGRRFVSCEMPELLDYKGAQILLIAARGGEEGLETSLKEGRGNALAETEEEESNEAIEKVFRELAMDAAKYPVEALEGEWI